MEYECMTSLKYLIYYIKPFLLLNMINKINHIYYHIFRIIEKLDAFKF